MHSIQGQQSRGKNGISSTTVITVVAPIAVCAVLIIAGFCLLKRGAKKKYNAVPEENADNDITTLESLQFDLGTIEVATDRFSTDNKLGEGGFGEVYKAVLPNGQEIAVKRLSKTSGQGAENLRMRSWWSPSFNTEIWLGYWDYAWREKRRYLSTNLCLTEALTIFYMIIGGIARRIFYLHEDSRLRIIYSDLKTSNILLDADMNKKNSDFDMARIFGVDQTQENTSIIVGTCGYLSPEYAMHGHYSVKSDVYNFGVLVLEIITGKKNSNFCQTYGAEDLLSYEDPTERPSMATAVQMLNNYSVTIASPQQPAFFFGVQTERNISTEKSASKSDPTSGDEALITEVYPR
ncbi:Receptor-like kinase [Melia azedarach]|uniref:Receptor-like kinase n=1 Tax=Melia azedarach TaxID=155640 RepID=A0ACC1WZ41_MELAZ|nr:Receptor-like kinase [Melia azedarach]